MVRSPRREEAEMTLLLMIAYPLMYLFIVGIFIWTLTGWVAG